MNIFLCFYVYYLNIANRVANAVCEILTMWNKGYVFMAESTNVCRLCMSLYCKEMAMGNSISPDFESHVTSSTLPLAPIKSQDENQDFGPTMHCSFSYTALFPHPKWLNKIQSAKDFKNTNIRVKCTLLC